VGDQGAENAQGEPFCGGRSHEIPVGRMDEGAPEKKEEKNREQRARDQRLTRRSLGEGMPSAENHERREERDEARADPRRGSSGPAGIDRGRGDEEEGQPDQDAQTDAHRDLPGQRDRPRRGL
jgi:hypothetical protein